MTRLEHLDWAKDRALGCLEFDQPMNAVLSMISDLCKHEELQRGLLNEIAVAPLRANRAEAELWIMAMWVKGKAL